MALVDWSSVNLVGEAEPVPTTRGTLHFNPDESELAYRQGVTIRGGRIAAYQTGPRVLVRSHSREAAGMILVPHRGLFKVT